MSRRRIIRITEMSYPNPDGRYNVSIGAIGRARKREYTATETNVNRLASVVDFTVEFGGGNIVAFGLYGEPDPVQRRRRVSDMQDEIARMIEDGYKTQAPQNIIDGDSPIVHTWTCQTCGHVGLVYKPLYRWPYDNPLEEYKRPSYRPIASCPECGDWFEF